LNTDKISCTSLVLRQRNNPNKKTLIYIPYASLHRSPSVYNPNYKTTWWIID